MPCSARDFVHHLCRLEVVSSFAVVSHPLLRCSLSFYRCRSNSYDCATCIDSGCYWCPGDGSCVGSPLYPQLFDLTDSPCFDPDLYMTDTCSPPTAFFNDPLYTAQEWVYDLIRVRPVWEAGFFGRGVHVRINDNGIDAQNSEFEGRVDVEHSCEIYEPTDTSSPLAYHGTAMASVIGAAGNNGECAVGISPEVTLSSCNYLEYGNQSLIHDYDVVDVMSNSFGIDGCMKYRRRQLQKAQAATSHTSSNTNSSTIATVVEGGCPFQIANDDGSQSPCDFCNFTDDLSFLCQNAIVSHCRDFFEEDNDACIEFLDLIIGGQCEYNVISEDTLDEITLGIQKGRGGKGILFVFASGNQFVFGDTTNMQPFTNSRYVITCGGVRKDGKHASYSVGGPGLFVTAPGGDENTAPNHITANLGGGCRDATYATSLSTAVVAGVIALMIEANPLLSWRDVQWILATTSQAMENDPYDGTSTINSAGLWHSEWYGFGIVDAEAAVLASQSWEQVEPEDILVGESGPLNLSIPDATSSSTAVITSMYLPPPNGDSDFIAEGVDVYLDIDHSSRGHLEIVLTSPQGTQSVLHPGRRPETTQLAEGARWKLLTLRSWGESAIGEWTLSIADRVEGDVSECVNGPWSIELPSGHEIQCFDLGRLGLCSDGILDPSGELRDGGLYDAVFLAKDGTMLASDACCACGGGMDVDGIVNQLLQWRLTVYGQQKGLFESETEPPSVSPDENTTVTQPSEQGSIGLDPAIAPASRTTPRFAIPSSSRLLVVSLSGLAVELLKFFSLSSTML